MENTLVIWYGATSFILGVVLFFPMRKIILAMSVNRLARKEKREVTAEEMTRIKKWVTVIAGLIAVTFAFLYNRFVMFKYFGDLQG